MHIQLSLRTEKANLLTPHSICAITAVRLKFVIHLDYADPTYALADFGIFAALEPLLGIINACLPVLPVVFKMILTKFGLSVSSDPSTKGVSAAQNNSWGRPTYVQPSFSSQKKPFTRLEDGDMSDQYDYPLRDIGGLNKSGASHGSADDLRANDGHRGGSDEPEAITVTTDWTVRSETQSRRVLPGEAV